MRRLYDAYNNRDAETFVTLLAPDVDWPDGARRLHGHAAVRAYWNEQWRRIGGRDVTSVLRIDSEVGKQRAIPVWKRVATIMLPGHEAA